MQSSSLPWSLLALLQTSAADVSLPYHPTTVLATTNATHLYILRSALDNAKQAVLQTVDVSRNFSSNTLSPNTLSPRLPFLNDDTLVPYLPMLDAAGNITVLTGGCAEGSDSTVVWRYTGQWHKHSTRATELRVSGNLTGVNYLSNGVAFSADVDNSDAAPDFYAFGGMCPHGDSTTATWQGTADYSQTMLVYSSEGGGEGGQETYEINNTAARGPPIVEAGFTMTGLTPTFRVNATGAAQTQQQDFLLLGGHTQDAFLNTSQVALFSLPQASWSFLPVQQPSAGRTDLAARDVSMIEPRSGHTAVLSEDGSKIIVVGGWVGEVTNPAKPQLAVLHLGSEYGGDAAEAWKWTVPSPSGNGIAENTGIFGHGAAMLPGGVVMIVGGYSIPAPSSSRFVKRQTRASDQVLLFNATSNEWIDSYVNPSSTGSESTSDDGASSETSQRTSLGLGLGLGLGVLVLVSLIFAYFWYSRRLKKQKEERQQALLNFNNGSFTTRDRPFLGHGSVHERRSGPYVAVEGGTAMEQAASTGLFMNVPSPTRGLRNAMANRPYSYHQAARYDEGRVNRGSGNIHPILERQDEDDLERSLTSRDPFLDPSSTLEPGQVRDGFGPAESKLQELQRVLHSGTESSLCRDPFKDPVPNPLGSHPNSPKSPNAADTLRRVPTYVARDHVIERKPVPSAHDPNWEVIEHDHDEASGSSSGPSSGPASSSGRLSPTKTDDRTSSTLSEHSTRSLGSTTSITRTMSTRTGALLAAALARREGDGTPGTSPLETRTATMTTTASSSGRKSPYYFHGSHTESQRRFKRESKKPILEPIDSAGKSTESFVTAHSSFIGLQEEGKALLGGSPTFDRDDPYHRALAAHRSDTVPTEPRSAIADLSTSPQRRQGWMGSIRRALTTAMHDRSFSLTSQNKLAHDGLETRTSSSSPTRSSYHKPQPPRGVSEGAPRRAISDGGALLKLKRGQKDWDFSLHPYRDDPAIEGDWGEKPRSSLEVREAENEWDVEGAAAKRDVQVLFTVPKARLRVVNADVERASLRSASEGAVSRKQSLLSLTGTGGGATSTATTTAAAPARNGLVVQQLSREGSLNTLRSRSGGDVELRECESQMDVRMRGLLGSGSRVEEMGGRVGAAGGDGDGDTAL